MEIDRKEFYGKLRAKKSAKTSAVNLDTFEACFEKHLAAGTDVLYLGFSSGLSSTFNTGSGSLLLRANRRKFRQSPQSQPQP